VIVDFAFAMSSVSLAKFADMEISSDPA